MLCVAGLLTGPPSAHAVSDSEVFRDLRFVFLEPGARAVAMGGAFTAIGGDAVSAYYNPAALHFLPAWDVYLEHRSVDPGTENLDILTGSVAVDPVGGPTGLPYLEVTTAGDAARIDTPSFASFAWPFAIGTRPHRLTVAVSWQQVLSTDPRLADASSRFAFDTYPNTVVGSEVQVYSVATSSSGDLSADVVYWNASLSYDLTQDFSLGLTVSYAELDLEGQSVTEIDDPLQLLFDPTHPRLAGQLNQDVYGTSAASADSDFAYTIGLHWHPDSAFSGGQSPWGFGIAFAKGARFSVHEEVTFNGITDAAFETTLAVPDRYSAGVSYRTPRHWLFSAEYQRLEYSDLTEGFQAGVGFLTSPRLAAASYPVDPGATIDYEVNDSTVPRLGAEFRQRFAADGGCELTAQVGYFQSDDAGIGMTGFNSLDPAVNQAYVDSFAGDGTVRHFTAGAGVRWGRYALHLAGETSDVERQVVLGFRIGADRRAPAGAGVAP